MGPIERFLAGMAAAFAAALPLPSNNIAEPLAAELPALNDELALPILRPDPTAPALEAIDGATRG